MAENEEPHTQSEPMDWGHYFVDDIETLIRAEVASQLRDIKNLPVKELTKALQAELVKDMKVRTGVRK
jgi:hypothetical protein